MCLLALRQDIPRKRKLSNDFTNLPASRRKHQAGRANCSLQNPLGPKQPLRRLVTTLPYCLYTIPSSSGKQALTYTRR